MTRVDPELLDADRPSYSFVKGVLRRRGFVLTNRPAGEPWNWSAYSPGDRRTTLIAVGPLGRSDRRRLVEAAGSRGIEAYVALVRRSNVVLIEATDD